MEKETLIKIEWRAALLGAALYRDQSARTEDWRHGESILAIELDEDKKRCEAMISAQKEDDAVTIRIAYTFKTEQALADFDNAFYMIENKKKREVLEEERAAHVVRVEEIDKQLEQLGGADV